MVVVSSEISSVLTGTVGVDCGISIDIFYYFCITTFVQYSCIQKIVFADRIQFFSLCKSGYFSNIPNLL